jgi:outer membrane lipopolysaccharide assembly protein LptE/RlpB
VLVEPNEINLNRDISFDDSNILAKDLEEGLLWRDMNSDLVNQIMRRLSIIKPKNPDVETTTSNAAQGRTTRRAPRTRVAPALRPVRR